MHRRSRWLMIATALVVLIGGLWWWSQPNLDPRFAGRWRFYVAESPDPDALTDRDFMGPVRFDLAGTATFEGHTKAWGIDAQGRLVIEGENAMEIQQVSEATIVLKVEGSRNRFAILKRDSSG